jgi:hypothetical protein
MEAGYATEFAERLNRFMKTLAIIIPQKKINDTAMHL